MECITQRLLLRGGWKEVIIIIKACACTDESRVIEFFACLSAKTGLSTLYIQLYIYK